MKMISIVLLLALYFSVYAAMPAERGSIISAEGTVIAKNGTDNGNRGRVYPYGTLLSPMIGHTQMKSSNSTPKLAGVNGLEIYFDNELSPSQTRMQKSVQEIKGNDLNLNIIITLQKRIETIADRAKKENKADEVIAIIMESRSGKILSMASSNRYDPSMVSRENNKSLNINAVSYAHEPGTIIKPILFSMLLDQGLVKPTEMLNSHNGKYVLSTKTIVDDPPFKTLSAEDVIVHSSYIGIAQLAQRLNGYEIARGLERFGFVNFSGIDLPYEKRGNFPDSNKLDNQLYKAIVSYGYGLTSNPVQILSAYNVFNNNGCLISPKVANSLISSDKKVTPVHPSSDPIQIISPSTALQMKKILIKTVTIGTGKIAQTNGLEVGGKTGSVHIVKVENSSVAYNTSFYGFANDMNHDYTIGVLIREPRTKSTSSITAVPVFKSIVDMMVEERYLKPKMK